MYEKQRVLKYEWFWIVKLGDDNECSLEGHLAGKYDDSVARFNDPFFKS